MEYYSTEKINDHITLLRSITGELLYLVEGQEKAVLIDTCLGVGHLRSLVEKLTDKELLVLLTHGHIDHALGAPEFDRVYMNHKDLGLYQAQCPLPERKGYMQMGLAPEVFAGIEEKDFVPPTPDYQFLPLEDGMIFDLGGHRLFGSHQRQHGIPFKGGWNPDSRRCLQQFYLPFRGGDHLCGGLRGDDEKGAGADERAVQPGLYFSS